MEKNKKLLIAWTIFFVFLVLFLIFTKLYHDSQKENALCYQYRIIVDKKLRNEIQEADISNSEINSDTSLGDNNLREIPDITKEDVDKHLQLNNNSISKTPVATSLINKSSENSFLSFYEKVSCGYIPKISPDGGSVLDLYSAKFTDNKVNIKKITLVILLDYDTSPIYISEIIKQLADNKVTFVVPQYIKNLTEIANIILKSGNEFLLQIPTQSSVYNNAHSEPFLANMDTDILINKLHQLLASAIGVIGIANTSPTLLTKSSKDMMTISEELSKRGLIFLDLEKSNEVMRKISSESIELAYIHVSDMFQPQLNEKDLCEKTAISVFVKDFSAFITKFNKLNLKPKKEQKYILAPISAMLKK